MTKPSTKLLPQFAAAVAVVIGVAAGPPAASAAASWSAPPDNALRFELAPVPDDPEQFRCSWGEEAKLSLLEKLNRCDRSQLEKVESIVAPLDWERDELDYSPLPELLLWAQDLPKTVIVHKPLQAFAAYQEGKLVRWGPISTGAKRSPTPAGMYFLNWNSKGRRSTVNRDWFLRWYFNFENASGRSFHQYALPGSPASHGCIRLLGRDAEWLHDWGESWRLDKAGRNVTAYGTPVVILGEYDFDSEPAWRNPDLLEDGFRLSRAGHWIASVADTLSADKLPTTQPQAIGE